MDANIIEYYLFYFGAEIVKPQKVISKIVEYDYQKPHLKGEILKLIQAFQMRFKPTKYKSILHNETVVIMFA